MTVAKKKAARGAAARGTAAPAATVATRTRVVADSSRPSLLGATVGPLSETRRTRDPRQVRVVVPREAHGTRLDRFLAAALEGERDHVSRTELQRLIETGGVRIAGKVCKAADRVREGEVIDVSPSEPRKSSAQGQSGIAFDVLHVDEDIVVVMKPAGLVVHPARGHEDGTLVNGLLGRGLFDAARFDDANDTSAPDRVRPGIVHRLDRGTSGVMVVARNPAAREKLKAQFAEHTIERQYEAICVGEVDSKIFDTLHGRHPKDRLKFSTRVRTGKRAVTHVTVLERFSCATYVECKLETGRTHQIRVHLSDAGTPVLGDQLYGKAFKNDALGSISDVLGHQALHARVLGFLHPRTGDFMRFEAEAPPDFKVALTTLRALP